MQSRNPFEPPQAPADGLDPSLNMPQTRRPASIDRAFWLIVASSALGLLSYLTRGMHEPAGTVTLVLVILIGFAFLIRAGQNWARIVFLVFFALGCLGLCLSGTALIRVGTLYVVIICVQTAMQGYAAWLTFHTPGSQWFGRLRSPRS